MLGNGTQVDPFIIENATDLKNMKNNPEAFYELKSDIDLGGQNWVDGFNFIGQLNGNSHTISNFTLYNDGADTFFWDLSLNYPYNFSDIFNETIQSKIYNLTFSDFKMISTVNDNFNTTSLFCNIEGATIKNINIENIIIESQLYENNNENRFIIAENVLGATIENINIENITTLNNYSDFMIFYKIESQSDGYGQKKAIINKIKISQIDNIIGYPQRGFFAYNTKGYLNAEVEISNIVIEEVDYVAQDFALSLFIYEIGDYINMMKIAFKSINVVSQHRGLYRFGILTNNYIRSNGSFSDIYFKDINLDFSVDKPSYFGLICSDIGRNNYTYQENIRFKNIYANNINIQGGIIYPSLLIGRLGEYINNLSIENIYIKETDIPAIGENTSGNNYNITKLSDEEFKISSSYVGFDFSNVWGIKSAYNDGHPYLAEMEEPPAMVGKIQFVGEKIIDMVNMLADTMGKKININNEGKFELINRRGISDLQPDYIYNDSDNTEWYDAEWNDSEIVTQVKVSGRNVEAPRQVIQEEKLLIDEKVLIPSGGNNKLTRNFYYSQNQKNRAVEIRIDIDIEDRRFDGNDNYKIIAINPYYIRMKFTNHSRWNSDGEFDVKIYGKPVAEIPPGQIQGVAENNQLISKYGIITKEIDNPLLQSFETVQAKAEEELFFNNIKSKKIKLKLLSDVRIQPGKILSVYHPVYNTQIKLYVSEVSHRSERGSEDSTTITGYVL